MTTTQAPVAGAVETSTRVASHLHPLGSFSVEDHPVPSGREEVWRFTPVRRFAPLFQVTPTAPDALSIDVPAEFHAAGLARKQGVRGSVLLPADRPAAIASALCEEALHLVVPAERVVAEPIRVALHGDGPERRSNLHTVIEAGANSRATIVLHHTGAGQHLGNVEVVVGPGAELTLVSLQEWEPGSLHAGQHEALVGPGGAYKHIAVSFGGDVRLASNVSYAGHGGTAEMFGLYFADAGQHLEHRLFVDHNNPGGESTVDYRGALQGEGAHSVWIGDVLIRKEAQDIKTYEKNSNLVLTDGCRADSVPNLEIETGEIRGAGHASTTGRFDDEQLFYLRSRGIEEAEARRLVIRGFFADIVRRIGVSDVEEALMATVERELARSVGEAA